VYHQKLLIQRKKIEYYNKLMKNTNINRFISFPDVLFAALEAARGDVPRSRYICRILSKELLHGQAKRDVETDTIIHIFFSKTHANPLFAAIINNILVLFILNFVLCTMSSLCKK